MGGAGKESCRVGRWAHTRPCDLMYTAQWAREFNLELTWERAAINDATAPAERNLSNAKTEKVAGCQS
jgi:hypothetical protein